MQGGESGRVRCPTCGAEAAAGARFCALDGAPLAPVHPRPELKGLTLADRWQVQSCLGKRATDSLYRGLELETEQEVAIHLFDGGLDAEAAAKLQTEAERAAGLRHPGLLAMRETGTHEGCVYRVEPWCEGRRLAELIAEGPLETGRALRIALDVLSALTALHRAGLVHGLVRPDRVLVVRDWSGGERALLAGAGTRHAVALQAAPLKLPGVCLADPAYLAPEVFAGAAPSPQTDLFGVGLLLGEMLTGEALLQVEGFVERAAAAVQAPDLEPRRLRQALNWALAEEPGSRPVSAAAFGRALGHWQEPPHELIMVRDALEQAEEAAREAEDYSALAQILSERAAAASDRVWRVASLFELAEVYEEHLGDGAEAAAAYSRVLDEEPDDVDALERLIALHERAGDHEALGALLVDRVRWSADPDEQVELLERAASLHEVQDPERALELLGRAFEITADDLRLGGQLIDLAEQCDRLPQLRDLYAEVVRRAPEPAPLLRRLGEWDAEGRLGLALSHYARLVELEPEDGEASAAYEALLARAGRWDEACVHLRGRLASALDPDEHVEVLLRLAEALERSSEPAEAAAEVRQQALELGAADEDNLLALEGLLTQLERWPALLDLLEQRAVNAPSTEERVRLQLRVGELSRTQVSDESRAIAAYRAVLEDEPGSREALPALEALLEAQGRGDELLEAYRRALPTRAPEERAVLMLRMADLLAARIEATEPPRYGEDPREAMREALIDVLWEAHQLEPRRGAPVERLERLFAEVERPEQLAVLLRQHIDALEDAPIAVEVRRRLAELYAGPLADAQQAAEVLRETLQVAPADAASVARLRGLYESMEAWPELIDLLGRALHWSDDAGERAERWCRIGRILLDALEDPEGAERRFREVLLYAPQSTDALRGLAEIAEGREDWPEAVAALGRLVEVAEDAEVLRHIGDLRADRLGDLPAAVSAWQACVRADPGQTAAAERLASYYEAEERWSEAAAMHALRLESAATPLEVHLALARCAEAGEVHEEAFEHYRQAFEIDGTDLRALLGLSRQLFRRQAWARALNVYQTLVLHHGKALDDATRAEVFFRQALIKKAQGSSERALADFQKTLATTPDHPEALQAMIELSEADGDWAESIRWRRRMLEGLEDTGARAELLLRIGDTWRTRLEAPQEAAAAYQEALAQDSDERALERLVGLARAAEDWSQVAALLHQRAAASEESAERARHLYAAACVERDRLRQREQALETLEAAAEAWPAMLEAFHAIDQLLDTVSPPRRRQTLDRLLAIGEALAPSLVADLAARLGRLHALRKEGAQEAMAAYRRALGARPEDIGSLEALITLEEAQGEAEWALEHTWQILRLQPRRATHVHRLQSLLHKAGRPDAAWCVCEVLALRGGADAEELSHYEAHRPTGVVQVQGQLEDSRLLEHVETSPVLSGLFGAVEGRALMGLAATLPDHPPLQEGPIAEALAYAAHALGCEPLPCRRGPQGLNLLWAGEPVLLAGPEIDALDTLELVFRCARATWFAQPGRILAGAEDGGRATYARLQALLRAVAMKVAPFDASEPEEAQRFGAWLEELDRDAVAAHDLGGWLLALDCAADRFGLLLTGDLPGVVELLRRVPGRSEAPPQSRITQLVAFALSADHFNLRAQVGRADAIQASAAP